MSRRSYPAYKASGIFWARQIPASWGVTTLRREVDIKKRIAGVRGYDVLSITQKGIKVKDIESGDGQLSSDYTKYQLVEPGDLAMNHMDLLTGFVDLSPFRGVTSPDYRVFSLKQTSRLTGIYLLRVLQACYQEKLFFSLGKGSSHLGRWRLPTDAFYGFAVPIPPPLDQAPAATQNPPPVAGSNSPTLSTRRGA